MNAINEIARDLESHGIDIEVPTDYYIVIFWAEDWMLDIAHDVLDRYVRLGKIANYYFEPADSGGLMYDRSDMGIAIDY